VTVTVRMSSYGIGAAPLLDRNDRALSESVVGGSQHGYVADRALAMDDRVGGLYHSRRGGVHKQVG
jgi:hypothetical protein